MKTTTDAGTRLASMVLDHFVMTFVAMLFFIPGMLSSFAAAFRVGHEQSTAFAVGSLFYIGLFGLSLYLCKDAFNGRSVGKRMLKLQVVHNETEVAASPLRCFIRNLFCGLWPVEVIVTVASPGRRIGDLVAGTKVVPFNSDTEQPPPNYWQIGLTVAIAYLFMLLFMLPFEGIRSMINDRHVSFVEASINNVAAAELVDLFEKELGHELTADVRLYDEIEEDPDLRYMSIILTLKKDYLADDDSFETIREKVNPVIFTLYPKGTFVGQVKYVYRKPGTMIMRTVPLDWREE